MLISWRAVGWLLGLGSAVLWGLAYIAQDVTSYVVSSVFSVGVLAALVLGDND